MNRHLTPIISSNDNTKAFLPTRKEITEDFKRELRKTIKTTLHKLMVVHSDGKNIYDTLTDEVIDLIIDFNPTQTYKSRHRSENALEVLESIMERKAEAGNE